MATNVNLQFEKEEPQNKEKMAIVKSLNLSLRTCIKIPHPLYLVFIFRFYPFDRIHILPQHNIVFQIQTKF